MITNNTKEVDTMLFKFTIAIGIIFFIIPTLLIFMRMRLLMWLKSNKQKTDRAINKHYEKEHEEIYQREYKPFYQYTVQLFNEKIKSRKMDRKHILEFKRILNKSLGSYINLYNDWNFKNDAMEIYSKLKSTHLDKSDFENLIQYLEKLG